MIDSRINILSTGITYSYLGGITKTLQQYQLFL